MTTSRYKGFTIVAMPYRVSASKRWTVDIEIRRSGRRQPFSLHERYRTEQEADARCSRLGRKIIDGEVPGWSVDHLRSRPGKYREQLIAAGLAILVVGTLVLSREPGLLSWQGLVSTIQIAIDQQRTLPLWGGGAALMTGVGFIAAGSRKLS